MKKFKDWLVAQKTIISEISRIKGRSLAEKVQPLEATLSLDNEQVVELSSATEDDIADILRMQKLSYDGAIPWGEGALRRELTQNKKALYLIARDQKKAVGFIGTWFVNGESHITNIAVIPEMRRNGLAYSLIKKIIEIAEQQEMDKVSLEVRVSNKQAQNLYLKLGFAKTGLKKRYYASDHEDALEMSLPLLRM